MCSNLTSSSSNHSLILTESSTGTYRPGTGITGAELIFTLSKRLKEYEKRDNSPVRVLFRTRVMSVKTEKDDELDHVVGVHCEPVKSKKKKKKSKKKKETTTLTGPFEL